MTDLAEFRKQMSAASINDLPDSAFAYIEPGGKKDAQGKTTPRSKRHFPVHDAAHVRNALARMSQSPFGEKARSKIIAAARKHGVQVSENRSETTQVVTAAEPQYRVYSQELEIRSRGDGRTVTGIAVPWDAPQMIDDSLIEEFAPGAFAHQIEEVRAVAAGRRGSGIRFAWEHVKLGGHMIGAVIEMRNDPAGQYVEMRVANTTKGDEALELIKVGALNQLSVGFIPKENQRLGYRGNAEHLRRVKADMTEVAVTMAGAYGRGAEIAAVRSGEALPAQKQVEVNTNHLELRTRAEKYMNMPELPDLDFELRRIRLGL